MVSVCLCCHLVPMVRLSDKVVYPLNQGLQENAYPSNRGQAGWILLSPI